MASSQDAATIATPTAGVATNPATERPHGRLNRVPIATYRIQLRSDFGLDDVRALLPYLRRLGISDVYLSPLFQAREESSHGYDVIDHGAVESAFGGLPAFQRLAESTREAGMGLLMDVVPNHMGINDPGNIWWWDVLEIGEASPYAEFFDIDWQPAATNMQHQVLLPCLGAPIGTVLEQGELRIEYVDQGFCLAYWSNRFPIAPPTVTFILDLIGEELARKLHEASGTNVGDIEKDVSELTKIVSQLRHLTPPAPGKPDTVEAWRRDQHAALDQFDALLERSSATRAALEASLAQLNGEVGNPRSFDQLEQLIDQQWYRLAYWRVATDEINYRRFFDINELAAIRVEDPRVFAAVHRIVALCLEERWVTGLRIDHPDGLLDPKAYFEDLQRLYRSSKQNGADDAEEQIYIIAEKILAADEELPDDWAVCGTTGYEFLNLLSRVLVDEQGYTKLLNAYEQLTGEDETPAVVLYESKRAILSLSMASELQMLTSQLYRIAQQHRSSRDFTRPTLQRALREVLAALSVYRTYVRPEGWDVSEEDYRRVTTAVRWAKRRNRAADFSVFDFIAGVLLLQNPPSLTPEQAADRRRFALKFQQVSGPVAAKGVEDTAFYRYYPLAAMNEVGGELEAEPLSVDEFHRVMRHRFEQWPHAMSSTATHDTKRGEELRARLLVLSEISEQWQATFRRWQEMNRKLVQVIDGDPAPNSNEEYLIYQTLVGTWPLGEMSAAERDDYIRRLIQYMEKALREAKRHTSWLNPNQEYEEAIFSFIRSLFEESSRLFQEEVSALVAEIATAGFVNALSQLVLKITLPGLPDFYQGTEFWDFNLVDPDNRRPVNFEERSKSLDEILESSNGNFAAFAQQLRQRWPDPRIKQFMIARALKLRERWHDVFAYGDYIPLKVAGTHGDHVIAFARRIEERSVIVAVPRLVQRRLAPPAQQVTRPDWTIEWDDTALLIPEEFLTNGWCDELSGQSHETKSLDGSAALELAGLLKTWPVTILTPNRP